MLMTPAAIAAQLSFWAALPFLAILLLIALMPALAPHWWESNRNRGIVMGLIALPFAAGSSIPLATAGSSSSCMQASSTSPSYRSS